LAVSDDIDSRNHEWESAFNHQSIQTLCFDRVGSTMEVARRMRSLAVLERPIAILADQQFAGRGRQGRAWESVQGSISLTYVFRYPAEIEKLAGLSLVVGVASLDVFEQFGASLSLKWPNDLCDRDGKKLGGILIEIVPEERQAYVLVGLGINFSRKAPVDVPVTSLRDLVGEMPSRNEFVSRLHSSVFKNWTLFIEKGFSEFRELWQQRALYLGKVLEVTVGSELYSGVFTGIGSKGELELDIKGKVKQFMSVDRVRPLEYG